MDVIRFIFKSASFIIPLLFSVSGIPSFSASRELSDWSLFLRKDSLQVESVATLKGPDYAKSENMYKSVGHHGPAVENEYTAFRLYCNDSGAIDVYSKKKGLELRKYLWYPSEGEQKSEGAGCDEYRVGKTVGLGGVTLWDGNEEIKLNATEGREAHAGRTVSGCFAEVISYGVPYCGRKVDIAVRIDVYDGLRAAKVTARELGGKPVRFLTGVNCHPGQTIHLEEGLLWSWGVHPADVSAHPIPIGGAVAYDKEVFGQAEKTDDMLRIISLPTGKIETWILSASVKEKHIQSSKDFSKLADGIKKKPLVSFEPEAGAFQLEGSKVLYDEKDAPVVGTAATLFAGDITSVTGLKSDAVSFGDGSPSIHCRRAVIVGTSASPIIARLAAGELKSLEGRWESYCIKIVKNPIPGIGEALVIAGSDSRGAAYGLMDISRGMGVSPWYWWCDIPIASHPSVWVNRVPVPSKEPSVRYRGIFINDEDQGLRPWAGLKDSRQDIGPDTYGKVCELLLRLKANHLLPAMHKCTTPFYSIEENPETVAKYGIVVGTSHCEPLMFNNASEWNGEKDGEWNYETNRGGVLQALDARVKQASRYENVYTVGMRGIHDRPMEADGDKRKAEITEMAIMDQRNILERYVGKPVDMIPQAFTPYKEVLETYDAGMRLPEDVTIVWPDDNFGHIKRVSTPLEQHRRGRSGVYYHVSFLGLPVANIWMSTTSTTLMYEELMKAYRASADRIWIVNCGDIKCCELQTDFFLNLAFDTDAFDYTKAADYPVDFVCSFLGQEYRKNVRESLGEALTLALSRRPDQMAWEWEMTDKSYRGASVDTDFSLNNYDELQRRLEAYAAASRAADKLMEAVPDQFKAPVFELVSFPVKSADAVNRSYLLAQKYRAWQLQGRSAASSVIDQSLAAQKEVKMLQDEYWNILDRKWDHVVLYPKYKYFKDVRNSFKECGDRAASASDRFGVESHLGEFSSQTRDTGLVEVYSCNGAVCGWKATVSDSWIKMSKMAGMVDGKECPVDSVFVNIDWDAIPRSFSSSGMICIESDGIRKYLNVTVSNNEEKIPEGYFLEKDGVVSISAAQYSRLSGCDGLRIESLRGIGVDGSALLFGEADGMLYDYRNGKGPVAEYDFWCSRAGRVDVYVYVVPQFPLNRERDYKIYNGSNAGIHYGVMIDNLAPRMEPEMNIVEFGENHKSSVLHEAFINKGTLYVDKPGLHTLKLMCGDPGVMYQKILIDFGGLKRSWNGPLPSISK